MAARRERRRPTTERQYRFAESAPEPAVDEALVEDGSPTEVAEPNQARARARSARAPAASAPATQVKPGRATKPFSAYREEYSYVYSDLRRVGVVVGSLLVVLIVLYFVLPLLAH